jgi:hypothetical protein
MEWMENRKEKNKISYIAFRTVSLAIKDVEYELILLDSKILYSEINGR